MTGTTAEDFERLGRETSMVTVLYHHLVGAAAGLSPVELQCIDLLGRRGAQSAGAIIAHTGLTSGSVTGLVDRLIARGVVRRERDPADGRRVLVELVPGPELGRIAALYQPLDVAFQALVDSYGAEEKRLIAGFIERMIALMADQINALGGEHTPDGRAPGEHL
jgi:DNA-binding MarR family transcriptional regulator